MSNGASDLQDVHERYLHVKSILRAAAQTARRNALDAELRSCGETLQRLQHDGVILGFQVDYPAHTLRVHLLGASEQIVIYMEI